MSTSESNAHNNNFVVKKDAALPEYSVAAAKKS